MTMQDEILSDVQRYLEKHKDFKLEDRQALFDSLMGELKRFRPIDQQTKILEIGSGTGWFPLLCEKNGILCKGLEISPQLVEFTHQLGRKYGLHPDIECANIDDADLGSERYDFVVAQSVFEHIHNWQDAMRKVHRALKPGGVFYFTSTNKFCPMSGEYPMLFYSWLPDQWRYRFRMARQGPDIMKLGIDFNQFTFFQLRRLFERLGYSQVYDLVQYRSPQHLLDPRPFRQLVLGTLKKVAPLRHVYLLFAGATFFICVK